MRSQRALIGSLLVSLGLVIASLLPLDQTRAVTEPTVGGTPLPVGTPIGGWKDWQTIALRDARTGASFTLADYYGQTVIVQPMATWCSDCRKQLQAIRQARATDAGKNIVVVAISVETALSDRDLADYAAAEGFDWRFAVASPELLRALVKEFGRALATPPSTPHFLLLPNGTFTDLKTGELSADEVIAWVQSATTR